MVLLVLVGCGGGDVGKAKPTGEVSDSVSEPIPEGFQYMPGRAGADGWHVKIAKVNPMGQRPDNFFRLRSPVISETDHLKNAYWIANADCSSLTIWLVDGPALPRGIGAVGDIKVDDGPVRAIKWSDRSDTYIILRADAAEWLEEEESLTLAWADLMRGASRLVVSIYYGYGGLSTRDPRDPWEAFAAFKTASAHYGVFPVSELPEILGKCRADEMSP